MFFLKKPTARSFCVKVVVLGGVFFAVAEQNAANGLLAIGEDAAQLQFYYG